MIYSEINKKIVHDIIFLFNGVEILLARVGLNKQNISNSFKLTQKMIINQRCFEIYKKENSSKEKLLRLFFCLPFSLYLFIDNCLNNDYLIFLLVKCPFLTDSNIISKFSNVLL